MTSEEFEEWESDFLTKKFFAFLADYRVSILEKMAAGGTMHPTSDATAISTSEHVARARLLHELVNLDSSAISEFYQQKGKVLS